MHVSHPNLLAGGVSVLDVDTREDVVERERREVCLPLQRALGPCCALILCSIAVGVAELRQLVLLCAVWFYSAK